MLKIWGRTTSSNVQKVLWCCGELGLEYERVDLGGPFGGNQDSEYLAMNPNGLVPTIKDGDLVMWESNTICRYLCSTYDGGHLYPTAPVARTHVERWMDWQLSSIGPPMGALLFGLIRTKPEQRDHAVIEAARRKALAAWMIVEDALEDRPFLAGPEMTLAEITLRNFGLSLARLFDRAAVVEKSQGMVRADARATPFQTIYRDPDHVMVSGLHGVLFCRHREVLSDVVCWHKSGQIRQGRLDAAVNENSVVGDCCGDWHRRVGWHRAGTGQGDSPEEPPGDDEGAR
jgi:glutathione S-transferase